MFRRSPGLVLRAGTATASGRRGSTRGQVAALSVPICRRGRPSSACATTSRRRTTPSCRCDSTSPTDGSRSRTPRGTCSPSTSGTSWPARSTTRLRTTGRTCWRTWTSSSGSCTRRSEVPAYLAYGSLLGAVRTGKFIPHDTDGDIAYVSRHETPALIVMEAFRVERALRRLGWSTHRLTGRLHAGMAPRQDHRVAHRRLHVVLRRRSLRHRPLGTRHCSESGRAAASARSPSRATPILHPPTPRRSWS